MNKKIKNALKNSFEAPPPMRKKAFFRSVTKPSISIFEFVCSQAAYIRKWVWGLSALIFAVTLIGAEFMDRDMLWCISAFMPLLALSVITESGRSEAFGMVEFELSARFSLKSVVLARLGILGAANFVLFCLLFPFAYKNSQVDILQTAVYMVCPYLVTSFGGLWTICKIHGRDSTYFCVGIAVSVCVGDLIFYQSFPTLFAEEKFILWLAAGIISAMGTAKQCYKVIKQTEELAWNL